MTAKRKKPARRIGPLWFDFLAIPIGLVAGLGAVAFRGLIALFHNLLFLGQWSFYYDANAHTPASPWGPFVILVPVVGAVGVAYLVKNFAPEAKGHGVPEVIDAIYYNRGIIRPMVALIKSLASALSIGSGGSVGREGPIIQIGSTFGSTVGQLLRLPPWQRITLIAAGAGGGIAATFNTPVGGVLFAVEVMMHEVSARTLVPVAISTATATYVSRLFFGAHASFIIPVLDRSYFHLTNVWLLFAYAALGTLMGLVSVLYIKSIYGFEDFFEKRIKGNYYTRHMGGMLVVGILMYGVMLSLGHYHIEGVGYATVQDVLSGTLRAFWTLLILFGLKLLVTSLTLGSGASGGIFSPSLYMGATLGAAFGLLVTWCVPGVEKGLPGFPIAGMAGVVAGATGAAMASIVMIFEMTADYGVIIPVTLTVAFSYAVRRMLSPESIYTFKLAQRGHYVPQALHVNFVFAKRAQDLMRSPLVALPASTTLKTFATRVLEHPEESQFLVHDNDRIVGLVDREPARESLDPEHRSMTLEQVANDRFVVVAKETPLGEVLAHMYAAGVPVALVADRAGATSLAAVCGAITDRETADAMVDSMELLSDEATDRDTASDPSQHPTRRASHQNEVTR